MNHRVLSSGIVVGLVLLTVLTAACGSTTNKTSASHGVNPPPRTPATLTPDETIDSDAKAINWVAPYLAGDTTFNVSGVESVSYVHTQYPAAQNFLYGPPKNATIAASIPDVSAWLFVEYGDFYQLGPVSQGSKRGPVMHTLWMLVEPRRRYPATGGLLTNACYDLSQLGTVHVITPGQVPQIDAKRAPGSTGALPSAAVRVAGVPCPAANATAIAETPSATPVPPTLAAGATTVAETAVAATPRPWPPTAAAAATRGAETAAALLATATAQASTPVP